MGKEWRLPTLGGWGLRIYTALWCALFAVSLVATAVAAKRSVWSGPVVVPTLALGFNYAPTAAGRTISEVAGRDARAAGLVPGTRLLAIAGPGEMDDNLQALSDLPDGAPVTITVEPPNGPARQVVLHAGRANVASSVRQAGFSLRALDIASVVVLLVPTLLTMAASLFLFVRQRRNPVAALLALLPLTVAATPLEVVPLDLFNGVITANQSLLPIALLAFPDGRFATRISRVLLVTAGVLIVAGLLAPQVFLHAGYPMLALCALAVVWRVRTSRSELERQQLRWGLIGFSLAALATLATFAATQALPLRDDLRYLIAALMAVDVTDAVFVLFLYGGLLVALLRYRLYDTDVVITRSLVWIVAAPVLAVFFGVATEVLKSALDVLLGGDTMAVTVAGVLTALMIGPVNKAVEKRVEGWSRRQLIALETDLPLAARDLQESDEDGQLLDYACRRVRTALSASEVVALVARDGTAGWTVAAAADDGREMMDGWLAATPLDPSSTAAIIDRDDIRFPFRVPLVARPSGEPQALGWLLIGPRPDGSVQDRPARAAVAGLSTVLGHALLVIAASERRRADLLAEIAGERTTQTAAL